MEGLEIKIEDEKKINDLTHEERIERRVRRSSLKETKINEENILEKNDNLNLNSQRQIREGISQERTGK
jgi:hypothetical protein